MLLFFVQQICCCLLRRRCAAHAGGWSIGEAAPRTFELTPFANRIIGAADRSMLLVGRD